jgi:integrase
MAQTYFLPQARRLGLCQSAFQRQTPLLGASDDAIPRRSGVAENQTGKARWMAHLPSVFRGRDSRHTYSTMLKQVETDIKVIQELLRHSRCDAHLDTDTQAIMPAKRAAQSAVLLMILAEGGTRQSQVKVAPFCTYEMRRNE